MPTKVVDNTSDYREMADAEDPNKKELRGKDARWMSKTVGIIITISVIGVIVLVHVTSHGSGDLRTLAARNHRYVEKYDEIVKSGQPLPPKWQVGVVGSMLGKNNASMMSAGLMAFLAFLCVVVATATSTIEVIRFPHLVPKDFEEKGTLSNVAQDTTQPNGRMFSVGLFTFGLLLIVSDYTTNLYRPWEAWIDESKQPFLTPAFEPPAEKYFRACWLLIPNVCFMFTAAFPSLSEATGMNFYLMILHNICAPFGMAVAVLMETYQLTHGELCLQYFFSHEATPHYGPLTCFQRYRVCVCLFAWIAILVFLSVQVYLGLGSMVGMKIKTWYNLSLVSYYGEVIGLNLVALLPTLAGMGALAEKGGMPSAAISAVVAIVEQTGSIYDQ